MSQRNGSFKAEEGWTIPAFLYEENRDLCLAARGRDCGAAALSEEVSCLCQGSDTAAAVLGGFFFWRWLIALLLLKTGVRRGGGLETASNSKAEGGSKRAKKLLESRSWTVLFIYYLFPAEINAFQVYKTLCWWSDGEGAFWGSTAQTARSLRWPPSICKPSWFKLK